MAARKHQTWVSLNDEEKETLTKAANAAGLSLGAFLRMCGLERVKAQ